MLNISIENYRNAKVNIIPIDDRELFWIKTNDALKGLAIKKHV